MWRVEISDQAEKTLLSFDKPIRQRVITYFRDRVEQHPSPAALAEPMTGHGMGFIDFALGITVQSAISKRKNWWFSVSRSAIEEACTANATQE